MSSVVAALFALSKLRRDATRLMSGEIGTVKRFGHLLLNPGFRALVLERLQETAHAAGWSVTESLILNLNFTLTGAEFRPGCLIGPGAVIRHPNGIVVGSGARIGEDCTLQHGVTVGEKYVDARSDGQYPIIGNGVVLGTHCVLVGGITVGNGVVVGALTFIDRNVSDGEVVVGRWKRSE